MARGVTYEMDAKTDKAFQAFTKLNDAERQALAQGGKLHRQAKQQNSAYSEMKNEVAGVARSFMGLTGGVAIIRTLGELMGKLREESAAIAKIADESAAKAVNLGLIETTGERRTDQLATALGAKYGVKSPQAIAVLQGLKSVSNLEEGLRGSQEAFKLTQLEADPATAMQLLQFFHGRGVGFERGAQLVTIGAMRSGIDIPQFGQAIPAISEFKDVTSAITTLAGLSENVLPGRLLASTEQVGRALNFPSEFTKTLTGAAKREGLDFEKMTENEKLALILRQVPAGPPSEIASADIERLGLKEKEAAGSIAKQLRVFTRTAVPLEQEIETLSADFLDANIARVKAENPNVALYMERKRQEAIFVAEQTYGPRALQYQAEQIADIKAGRRLNQMGLGVAVNQQTGIPSVPIPMIGVDAYNIGTGVDRMLFEGGVAAKSEAAGADWSEVVDTLKGILGETQGTRRAIQAQGLPVPNPNGG